MSCLFVTRYLFYGHFVVGVRNYCCLFISLYFVQGESRNAFCSLLLLVVILTSSNKIVIRFCLYLLVSIKSWSLLSYLIIIELGRLERRMFCVVKAVGAHCDGQRGTERETWKRCLNELSTTKLMLGDEVQVQLLLLLILSGPDKHKLCLIFCFLFFFL